MKTFGPASAIGNGNLSLRAPSSGAAVGKVPVIVSGSGDNWQLGLNDFPTVDAAAIAAALGYTPANAVHSHAIGDVSGLAGALAALQPLNTDLTAIAALATQPFGRSLLTQVDAAAARSMLGAQAALGYTPANRAGDTFTGNIYTGNAFDIGWSDAQFGRIGAGSIGVYGADGVTLAGLTASSYAIGPNHAIDFFAGEGRLRAFGGAPLSWTTTQVTIPSGARLSFPGTEVSNAAFIGSIRGTRTAREGIAVYNAGTANLGVIESATIDNPVGALTVGSAANGASFPGPVGINTQSTATALTLAHVFSGTALQINKAGAGAGINIASVSSQVAPLAVSQSDSGSTYLLNGHVHSGSFSTSSGVDAFSVCGIIASATQTRNTSGSNGGRPIGGSFSASTTANAPVGYGVLAQAVSARVIPIVARGVSGQTENLFQCQIASGAVVASIGATGNVLIGFGQTDAGTGASLSAATGIYTPGFVWATGGLNLTSANAITNATAGSLIVARFTSGAIQLVAGGPVVQNISSTGFNFLQANGTTPGNIAAGAIRASGPIGVNGATPVRPALTVSSTLADLMTALNLTGLISYP